TKMPESETPSSIIAVDGSNMTRNSGRFLINLKPHDQRSSDASAVIRRLKDSTAAVPGIELFMQPVQDLTVDDTVSKTQFQFILEDANPDELAEWSPRLVERLKELPQLADVATDLASQGLASYVEIVRSTAARFGITPATIANALYDAFGQRIVSINFTI